MRGGAWTSPALSPSRAAGLDTAGLRRAASQGRAEVRHGEELATSMDEPSAALGVRNDHDHHVMDVAAHDWGSSSIPCTGHGESPASWVQAQRAGVEGA